MRYKVRDIPRLGCRMGYTQQRHYSGDGALPRHYWSAFKTRQRNEKEMGCSERPSFSPALLEGGRISQIPMLTTTWMEIRNQAKEKTRKGYFNE